jgi:hypothetical protein
MDREEADVIFCTEMTKSITVEELNVLNRAFNGMVPDDCPFIVMISDDRTNISWKKKPKETKPKGAATKSKPVSESRYSVDEVL